MKDGELTSIRSPKHLLCSCVQRVKGQQQAGQCCGPTHGPLPACQWLMPQLTAASQQLHVLCCNKLTCCPDTPSLQIQRERVAARALSVTSSWRGVSSTVLVPRVSVHRVLT